MCIRDRDEALHALVLHVEHGAPHVAGAVLGVGSEAEIALSVSYTHLDVYKRQGRDYFNMNHRKSKHESEFYF